MHWRFLVEASQASRVFGALAWGFTSFDRVFLSYRTRVIRRCGDWMDHLKRWYHPAVNLSISDSDQITLLETIPGEENPGELRSDDLRVWLYRTMLRNLDERERRQNISNWPDRQLDRIANSENISSSSRAENLPGGDSSSNLALTDQEWAGQLANAIGALPLIERRVIIWRYWERLEYEEISKRLGVDSAQTAKSLHCKACRHLLENIGIPLS